MRKGSLGETRPDFIFVFVGVIEIILRVTTIQVCIIAKRAKVLRKGSHVFTIMLIGPNWVSKDTPKKGY